MIVLGLLVSCLVIADGASLSGRVIGGSTAPFRKYPYVVSLGIQNPGEKYSHFCGGTIINDRWILTAAKCIKGWELRNGSVVAGTNYLNGGGKSYMIQFSVRHPKYQDFHYDNIALVRIKGRIQFNNRVHPVTLPWKGMDESSLWSHIFVGWGYTHVNGQMQDALREIQMRTYANILCRKYQPKITENHLCTFEGYDKGFCYGDGGSPLIVSNVQVGIASYTKGSCASGNPDVFTRVSSYVDWIKEVSKEYDGKE